MTSFCSINSYLNDCWLLSMQAKTLIQTCIGIGITSATSAFEAWGQTSCGSIISSRNNSILLIYYNGANWAFHTIWSTSRDVSHFHEIIFPRWSEWFNYLFHFGLYLLLKKLYSLPIANSGSDELNTFFKLFIVLLIILFEKFIHLLWCILFASLDKVITVSFECRCFN